MKKINPLLFYMQPADYPDILENLDKIPCDKFIVKYAYYPVPHELAREFFLAHEEYTHLIVQPQDLLVTPDNYFKLIKMLREKDYPVLSGVCNVGGPESKDFYKWAVCKKLPSLIKTHRYYNWMPSTKEDLGVIRVGFQGMVFCAIKRNVMIRTLTDGTPIFKGCIHKNGGPAPDLNFCHNCEKLGIPIHADTNNRMFHYANHKPNLINVKPFETMFLKNGQSILA